MPIIGYWIRNFDDKDFLAPQEVAHQLPSDMVDKVVRYLRAGKIYSQYYGSSWCRFSSGCPMGGDELTDGYWIWPTGLIFYVAAYKVALPEVFLEDVLGKSVREKSNEEPDSSLDLWKHWCAENQNLDFRQELIIAHQITHQKVQKETEKDRREKTKALQLKFGISATICLHMGCSKQALKGRVFCGEHLLHTGEEDSLNMYYLKHFQEFLKDFGQKYVADLEYLKEVLEDFAQDMFCKLHLKCDR